MRGTLHEPLPDERDLHLLDELARCGKDSVDARLVAAPQGKERHVVAFGQTHEELSDRPAAPVPPVKPRGERRTDEDATPYSTGKVNHSVRGTTGGRDRRLVGGVRPP
jgi:hypothetical protein